MSKLLPDIELTTWPLITLVILVSLFIFMVFSVYRPARKNEFKKYGELPLKE